MYVITNKVYVGCPYIHVLQAFDTVSVYLIQWRVFVFFTVAESPWKTIQYKHSSEPRTSLSWPSDCAFSGRCQFSVVAFNYKSISYPSPPSEFISEYLVISSCCNVNINVWRSLQTCKTMQVSDTNTVYSVIFTSCYPFILPNNFAPF